VLACSCLLGQLAWQLKSLGGVDMTDYYKGERISELLDRIKILQSALEEGRGEITTPDRLIEFIEGEATLAIMKAKLTALQGEK
jgi:hypothetical protein